MIKMRRNAFETNSSSSHSIVVVKRNNLSKDEEPQPTRAYYDNNAYNSRPPSYKIEWWNEHGFDRAPFEILYSWVDKALYYMSDRLSWSRNKKEIDAVIDEVTKAIKTKHPEFNGFEKLTDSNGYFLGAVDHQSLGLATKAVKNMGLEEFLFNPKVIVVIDGDEYNIFGNLVDSGLINKDNFTGVKE